MTATRKAQFDKPRPADWTPKVGDRVYVNKINGTLARLASTGIVRVVVPEFGVARVRIEYGRISKDYCFTIDDLRPFPKHGGFVCK